MKPTSRARTQRGAAAVEFAIIFPVLFLVIAGIVDFGRAMYTEITLTNAAREGARAAITGTDPAGPKVRAEETAAGVPGATAEVTACSGSGSAATVTVSAPFDWMLLGPAMSLFGVAAVLPNPLESTAEMQCN